MCNKMFCNKCGCEVKNNSTFCSKCGNKIVSIGINQASNSGCDNSVRKAAVLFSKETLIGFVIVLLFMVGMGIYFFRNTPEKVIGEYLDAISSGNYDKAYAYLAFDETRFINKDLYVKSRNATEYRSNIEKIEFVILNDREQIDAKKDFYRFISSGEWVNPLKSINDLKAIKVKYKIAHKQTGRVSEVHKIKYYIEVSSGFLKDYRIIEPSIIKSMKFVVPTDSDVKFDGILMKPDYISNYVNEYSTTFEEKVFYGGSHKIDIEHNNLEGISLTWDSATALSNEINVIDDMWIKDTIINDLVKRNEEIQKKITNGAIERKEPQYLDKTQKDMWIDICNEFDLRSDKKVVSVIYDEFKNGRVYTVAKRNPQKLDGKVKYLEGKKIRQYVEFTFKYKTKDSRGNISVPRHGFGWLNVVYKMNSGRLDFYRVQDYGFCL